MISGHSNLIYLSTRNTFLYPQPYYRIHPHKERNTRMLHPSPGGIFVVKYRVLPTDIFPHVYSPDGQYIATGCYDGLIRVWESSGKLHMLLREHTGPVFSLKWSRSQQPQEDNEGVRNSLYWTTKCTVAIRSLPMQKKHYDHKRK